MGKDSDLVDLHVGLEDRWIGSESGKGIEGLTAEECRAKLAFVRRQANRLSMMGGNGRHLLEQIRVYRGLLGERLDRLEAEARDPDRHRRERTGQKSVLCGEEDG